MSFTYKDVLLKAASAVEEEGNWCQWKFEDPETGARCAVGHIAAAEHALDVVSDDPTGDAVEHLEATIGHIVTAWNDTPGRTAHEVAEAMRKAAE